MGDTRGVHSHGQLDGDSSGLREDPCGQRSRLVGTLTPQCRKHAAAKLAPRGRGWQGNPRLTDIPGPPVAVKGTSHRHQRQGKPGESRVNSSVKGVVEDAARRGCGC